MSELATYKNKYTGEIAKYLRCESVPNHPHPVSVHVLLIDGNEWRQYDESFIGFGASFLPIVPDMFMDGYRAGKKEWDGPKYKK